jgi:hypothetical protein
LEVSMPGIGGEGFGGLVNNDGSPWEMGVRGKSIRESSRPPLFVCGIDLTPGQEDQGLEGYEEEIMSVTGLGLGNTSQTEAKKSHLGKVVVGVVILLGFIAWYLGVGI